MAIWRSLVFIWLWLVKAVYSEPWWLVNAIIANSCGDYNHQQKVAILSILWVNNLERDENWCQKISGKWNLGFLCLSVKMKALSPCGFFYFLRWHQELALHPWLLPLTTVTVRVGWKVLINSLIHYNTFLLLSVTIVCPWVEETSFL